eukprot:10077850-Lingulodinium_polyedra.AAC.1
MPPDCELLPYQADLLPKHLVDARGGAGVLRARVAGGRRRPYCRDCSCYAAEGYIKGRYRAKQ